MENEQYLKEIKQEIKNRELYKIITSIKRITDQELKLNREKYLKKREEEYKRIGWLQK